MSSTASSPRSTNTATVAAVTGGILVVILIIGLAIYLNAAKSSKPLSHNLEEKLEEVKGAYGWNLGDVLPIQFQVETNDDAIGEGIKYVFDPTGIEESTKPSYCFLILTEDRRIAGIFCMGSDGYFDEDTIKNILKEKYGLRETVNQQFGLHKYFFGRKNRQVVLDTSKSNAKTTVFLNYQDEQLMELANKEIESRRSEKYSKIQKSLKANF